MELPSSISRHYSSVNTVDEPVRYRVSVTTIIRRFRNARRCISSKSACLLLALNFNAFFLYLFWNHPNFVTMLIPHKSLLQIVSYASGASLHLLCLLAGTFADNKMGRHRVIRLSTWILVSGISLAILMIIIAIITQLRKETNSFFTHSLPIILLVLVLIVLTVGIAGFEANSIQFGINQLLDFPWEDQSIFIYWFVWVWYLAYFIEALHQHFVKVHFYDSDQELVSKISSGIIMAVLLASTLILLILTSSRRRWILTDMRRHNPYKLIYQVTKFSRLHKVPVNRSAFTYCEDEIPSGLDLGKAKYGGPFTTEEVEDVKAFYGILKILFITGPSFQLIATFFSTGYYYERHFNLDLWNSTNFTASKAVESVFLENLVVFIVPLYLVILRPLISYYIPSMLKRMAVGIVVPTLLAVIFLVIDSLAHAENRALPCMFSSDWDDYNKLAFRSKLATQVSQYYIYVKVFSITVSSLTRYMVHVALFEFICSQSPYTMKGLLIGLSFAIEGLYSFLGSLFPLIFHYSWQKVTFPSCYMAYFLINVFLGLVALSLYVYVTRGYQYRMRDEPCHVHRYVEEYYSKIQEEENY